MKVTIAISKLICTFESTNKTTMRNEPQNIIEIPRLSQSLFQKNDDAYCRDYEKFYGQCPCCGKGIKEPKFFVNSIYGSEMYPANDNNQYKDAWHMPVGSECVKRIPSEYVIKGA